MKCQEAASLLKKNIEQIMVGSEQSCDLIMMSLLAGGHILLEDVPGTGKTTLAKAVAQSLNLSFKRVQFTPDLMPSDLIGIQFYNQAKGEFESRAPSQAYWKRWKNTRSAWRVQPIRCRSRSLSSQRRTRLKIREPSRCRKRRSTGL